MQYRKLMKKWKKMILLCFLYSSCTALVCFCFISLLPIWNFMLLLSFICSIFYIYAQRELFSIVTSFRWIFIPCEIHIYSNIPLLSPLVYHVQIDTNALFLSPSLSLFSLFSLSLTQSFSFFLFLFIENRNTQYYIFLS